MRISRGYRPDDVEIMHNISEAVFPENQRAPLGVFKHVLYTAEGWLAKEEDEILGYAIVDPTHKIAYLYSLAVRSDFQGRGVGGNILRELSLYYKKAGNTAIGLHVAIDNPAQKLYFDYGYRVYDIACKHYCDEKNDYTDALMMKRVL